VAAQAGVVLVGWRVMWAGHAQGNSSITATTCYESCVLSYILSLWQAGYRPPLCGPWSISVQRSFSRHRLRKISDFFFERTADFSDIADWQQVVTSRKE